MILFFTEKLCSLKKENIFSILRPKLFTVKRIKCTYIIIKYENNYEFLQTKIILRGVPTKNNKYKNLHKLLYCVKTILI